MRGHETDDSPMTPGSVWRPFRIMMWWSGGVSVVLVAGVLFWLDMQGVALGIHFVLALAGGIIGTLLLAGALMGLVFVSSRSGHDDNVGDQRRRGPL